MKFFIKEDRLSEIIEKHLDRMFDLSTINWTYYIDDDGNESDAAVQFYFGDYYGDEDNKTVFRLYDKSYWSDDTDFRVKLSPILMFEDGDDYKNLNSLFGDKWEPIFKNWFKKKLGFTIKTFDSY